MRTRGGAGSRRVCSNNDGQSSAAEWVPVCVGHPWGRGRQRDTDRACRSQELRRAYRFTPPPPRSTAGTWLAAPRCFRCERLRLSCCWEPAWGEAARARDSPGARSRPTANIRTAHATDTLSSPCPLPVSRHLKTPPLSTSSLRRHLAGSHRGRNGTRHPRPRGHRSSRRPLPLHVTPWRRWCHGSAERHPPDLNAPLYRGGSCAAAIDGAGAVERRDRWRVARVPQPVPQKALTAPSGSGSNSLTPPRRRGI